MADDPVSYEEAVKEKQRETDEEEEHLKGFPNYADEAEFDGDFEDLEERFRELKSKVEAVPDWLLPEGSNKPEFGGRAPDPRDIQIAANLEALDTRGLLEVIARVEIAQLATLFDISDYVEPLRNITVSGVNSIEDANEPEPVVPRSDEENVPTRILFIRADPQNTSEIAFGDDEVEPNSGFVLDNGETIFLEMDLRRQVLWMSSDTEGQSVQLMGVA